MTSIADFVRLRFPCIGGYRCDSDDSREVGHALGCPVTWRKRTIRAIEDYISENRRSLVRPRSKKKRLAR